MSNIEQLRAQANKLENTAQRTMISTSLNASVTQNDNIRLVSSFSILRYDTPDASNTDDRDEFLVTSGLEIYIVFHPVYFYRWLLISHFFIWYIFVRNKAPITTGTVLSGYRQVLNIRHLHGSGQ